MERLAKRLLYQTTQKTRQWTAPKLRNLTIVTSPYFLNTSDVTIVKLRELSRCPLSGFLCGLVLFLLIPYAAFANTLNLPQIVDLRSVSTADFLQYDDKELSMAARTLGGFNHAPEFIPFFLYLKTAYGIDTVIETGTWLGKTTACFSLLFNRVHTIEVRSDVYHNAKKKLEAYPNIECHLGSSEIVLEEFLPSLKGQPLLFYLDAHWRKFWPLLDELKAISKTHKDHCIIVIDDFKVPERPDIPYDAYGKDECSYEYIKKALDEVFSGYSFHYLIPKHIASHAKLVVIPKKWQQKS
jgi:hypothetical protein